MPIDLIDLSGAEITVLDKDYPAKHNGALTVVEAAVNATITAVNEAVETVSDNAANIATVAGIAPAVSAVSANGANVTAVAGNEGNINAVAANATNINAVAGNNANVTAVAGNSTNINAVAANETNIDTVAGALGDIATVVANLTDIQNAEENAVLAETAKTISINNALAAATSAASIADYSARVQAKLVSRGITGIKGIVISSAEGWEKQGQQSYKADTRPTGRMLGDYATATLAWAANYLGVATVTEDYYWNTTTDQQEKCTTSNLSTVTYRGSTDHLPLERAFVFTLTNLYVFDLTSPLMPLWKQFINAANTLYAGAAAPDWTGIGGAYFKDGRLVYGLSNGSNGRGLRIWDFKNDTTLHISTVATAFAGTLASCNSALGMKTVSTATASVLQNANVNGVVDVGGYIGVATDGGLSVVTPANKVIRSSSTNQFVFPRNLRGRLYAVNGTASPDSLNDYGPAAALGASFVPVNTWTTATVPALSDSTISGVVAADDHLVIHGSTAVDELWPDPTTMANSLIARKYTTAATPPMKKPELMAICGTATGSIVDTDITVNGTFDSDTGWTKSAGVTIAAGVCTFTGVASGQGIYQTGASMAIGDSFVYELTVNSITGSIQPHVAEYDVNLGAVISAPGTYTGTFIGPLRSATSRIGIKAVGVATCEIDNFVVRKAVSDFSKKSNHLTPHGTLTLTAHATGGVAMASGFTVNTNYLSAPNPWDGVGSGDGYLCGAFKTAASAVDERLLVLGYYDGAATLNAVVRVTVASTGTLQLFVSNDGGATNLQSISASTYDDGLVHHWIVKKNSSHYVVIVDGKEIMSVAIGAHGNLTFHAAATAIMGRSETGGSVAPNSSICLVSGGKVALTDTEVGLITQYMRNLVEGKAAFDELPSNLAYNELTDTIHCVGTTYEQTMRDGRVAVVGSHGVGATPVIACGPRGEVSYGGSTNLTVSVPERNLHEAEKPPLYEEKMFYDEELSLEGTIYWLPVGWEVVSVKLDGAESRKNKGSTVYGWALQQDAFRWGVDPTAAITNIAVVAGRYV